MSEDPPVPSVRAAKGMAFLLQQMRASTTVSTESDKTASVVTTTVVEPSETVAEASSESGPPSKRPKLAPVAIPNPWLVPSTPSVDPTLSYAHFSCDASSKLDLRQSLTDVFSSKKSRDGYHGIGVDNNYVRSLKWSSNGKYLLADSADMRVRIIPFEKDSGLIESEALDHCLGGLIYDTAWHPCLDIFAATSNGHPVQLFDSKLERLGTANCVNDFDEIDSPYSIGFTSDGIKLIAGFKSKVYLFDLQRPSKPISVIRTHSKKNVGQKGMLSCLATSPRHSENFAVGSYNGVIGFYTTQSRQAEMLFETTSKNVTQLKYAPDGNTLVYGCAKSAILQSLDVRFACKPLATFKRPVDTNQRIGFEFINGGKQLISGSTDTAVFVFDLNASEIESPDAIVRANVASRVCSDVAVHPEVAVVATSHGERVFPMPRFGDDSDDDEDVVALDFGVKLWGLNNNGLTV